MFLQIECQCPQCGAPAIIEETDRLFSCGYCRVKSYLLDKGGFQYVIPNKAPKDRNLIFFPYWRFKGMFFAHSEKIVHRVLDISHQAIESQLFPNTVGLRSQALQLQFISDKMEGRFLKPALPFSHVMENFKSLYITGIPKPVLHTEFIGESLNIIYSPFYVKDKIYDAVLNEPVSEPLPPNVDLFKIPGGSPLWNIEFIPCMCPYCGWDLDGERDSLTLMCKNCNRLWQSGRNGLKELPFGCLQPKDKDTSVTYLPFWRIKAEIEGVQLENYADMVKIANLPKVVPKKSAEDPFHFWAVAFKIRPNMLLKLNRRMTLVQPKKRYKPVLPDSKMVQVNLPISEAVESLKSTLATFIIPKKFLMEHLPDIKITAKKYKLVYIPFREEHHELIHPEVNIGVQKSMLKHARNL